MSICIVLAGLLSIFSVFCFFGKAVSNTGNSDIPNMFQLMFRREIENTGTYQQNFNLTLLFILYILIVLGVIVAFVILYDVGESSKLVMASLLLGFASILVSAISFATLPAYSQTIDKDVSLGVGPILYSIFNIIAALLYFGVAVIFRHSTHKSFDVSHKSIDSIPSSSSQAILEKEENKDKPKANKNDNLDKEELNEEVEVEIEVNKEEQKPVFKSDSLIDTKKEYVEPVPSNGVAIYWNNHFRGEVVKLDTPVGNIPAGTYGRVLGLNPNMMIDIQIEIDGKEEVISVYNQSISIVNN